LVTWPNLEHWVGLPVGNELLVWSLIYDGLLIINSVIGVTWLLRRWRRYGPAFVVDAESPS
jgi:hypothetical protein